MKKVKPKKGRPKMNYNPNKMTAVYLDETTRAILKTYGEGNVSAGIRKLAASIIEKS